MKKSAILITGANGEMGRGLIKSLANTNLDIITIDLHPIIDADLAIEIYEENIGSILDSKLLETLNEKY